MSTTMPTITGLTAGPATRPPRPAVLHGLTAAGTALALLLPGLPAEAAPKRATIEAGASRGKLTRGQPSATSATSAWLRGQLHLGDDLVRAELLQERKFGADGGLLVLGYTHVPTPDWTVTGTLAAGHGRDHWARHRLDVEVGRAWGAQRQFVTRLGVYRAAYASPRHEHGVRLGGAWYAPGGLVLEAGVTANTAQPGRVRSSMPFVAATWGRDGEQYLSLRLAKGSEAWQPLAAGAELVDFDSETATLTWRRWLGPDWGMQLQAEHYRNPNYRRQTLGVSGFAQW